MTLDSPGLYLVTIGADIDARGPTLATAPIDLTTVERLLERCPKITLDGQPKPSADELADRIASYWLPDETVLYIGRTTRTVTRRVKEYVVHVLGDTGPHKGGWWLKTLGILDDLYVHVAASASSKLDEDALLRAFAADVSSETRLIVRTPDRLGPFANLEVCGGYRRGHGIRGAACRPPSGRRGKVQE